VVGLSCSTAALAAPGSRVPEQNEQRQWRPLDQALDVLWQAGAWREELIQLLELLAERADRRLHPLPWALPVPLRVHGHYTRAEIEAAFGVLSTESPWIHREGVLWNDLALGPSLFHWESQSTTTASSATGQRYIHHAERGSRGCCLCLSNASRMAAPAAPSGFFSVSGHGISSGPDQLQLAERSASKAAAHPGNGSR
jgi:hypothetical protein